MADVYEQLYSWTFKFRKVMRQRIWDEVANFIPSFSAVYLIMQKWKDYRIKIGSRLPKLSQKDCVGVFWLTV